MRKMILRTMAFPVGLMLLALSACSTAKHLVDKPQLTFRGLDIQGLSLNAATFLVRFDVENPNSFDVRLDRIDYRLSFNNRQLAAGDLNQKFEVGGEEKKSIELPVKIKYVDLMTIFRDFAKSKKTSFLLAGSVKSGPFTLPFEEKGEVELPIPLPDEG